MNIMFGKYACRLVFSKYMNNDRTAIILEDLSDLSIVATATVNIPEYNLDPDEVIIKDYSENEGMLECLMLNIVVSKPLRWVKTGFVKCPVCKLLIEPEYEN